MKPIVAILALSVMAFACNSKKEETALNSYPETHKVDTVDTYFGEKVADPYRWLENDTTPETAGWVAAQNKVTFGYLDKISYRDKLKKRIEDLNNFEKLGAPFQKGDYLYYFRNEGLQNHSVLYRKQGDNGTPEVFIDPNTFSADATTKLSGVYFTEDGSLCAYQISRGGADWTDVIVLRTKDKSVVEDTLRDVKFSGIAWKDTEGFYFSTYDKPQGSQLSAKTQNHKLYYHKLGTPHAQNILVFGGDQTPRRYIGADVTEDGRFLLVSAATSTTGNELYAQDLKTPGSKLVTLVGNFDNTHNVIDNEGTRLLIETNLNAPNNRLVEVDFANPTPDHWKDLIPETEHVLSTSTTGGKIFAEYMIDVKSQIKQYSMNGKLDHEIELPGIGSAGWTSGRVKDKDIYYTFTSFTYPTTIFKYTIATGKSTEYQRPKIDFNPDDYETKQVFYPSKDGTKIPMFIVYKKGLELNGKNPTWLYAYGGFNISLTPGFAPSRIAWLENGGVYAQPNLRGGGEYGEKWHTAGTKLQKQNVFDDFIAAGEYLIKEKYTSSSYLAIAGGSNGGLLVGATMTQRPDLAKVAFPGVGVMDMLRYHKFTAGAGWAYDYGTAEDSKEMFEYLKAYSPVHALKPGTAYPATLVTTADHDDRVVPAHSFKFAATLQADHQGPNPVLIRVDVKSGHGSSNLSKAIELVADQYAFAWYNMGVMPEFVKKDM